MEYKLCNNEKDLIEFIETLEKQYNTKIKIIAITQAINTFTLFYEIKGD